ncbi:hypothetical protein [Solimonas soli]|uniref:hypothetical protein n=1 Tax=Solimonas soli TaxID=413479 RepID=UPI000485A45D|nr:hypothetical protein [Solimonas soli]
MRALVLLLAVAASGAPSLVAAAAGCDLAAPPAYVAQHGEAARAAGAAVRMAGERGSRDTWIDGAACTRRWVPRVDRDRRALTEIHWHYRRELQALGAQLLFRDWRHTVARLPLPGGTRWIQVYSPPGAIDVTVIDVVASDHGR